MAASVMFHLAGVDKAAFVEGVAADPQTYADWAGGEWTIETLAGRRPLPLGEPVAHLSFYEADAYASWRSENHASCRGARLPTEQEWEHGARHSGFSTDRGDFLDDRRLHVLNPSAGAIWDELGRSTTMADVVLGVADRFAVEPSMVRDDVGRLLDRFRADGPFQLER